MIGRGGFTALLPLAAGDTAREAAAREDEFTFRPVRRTTTLGHSKFQHGSGKKGLISGYVQVTGADSPTLSYLLFTEVHETIN